MEHFGELERQTEPMVNSLPESLMKISSGRARGGTRYSPRRSRASRVIIGKERASEREAERKRRRKERGSCWARTCHAFETPGFFLLSLSVKFPERDEASA